MVIGYLFSHFTVRQTVPQTVTITHDVHLPRIVSLLLFHFTLSLNIAWTALASLGYKDAVNRTWILRNWFVVCDIQVSTLCFRECCYSTTPLQM